MVFSRTKFFQNRFTLRTVLGNYFNSPLLMISITVTIIIHILKNLSTVFLKNFLNMRKFVKSTLPDVLFAIHIYIVIRVLPFLFFHGYFEFLPSFLFFNRHLDLVRHSYFLIVILSVSERSTKVYRSTARRSFTTFRMTCEMRMTGTHRHSESLAKNLPTE